LGLKKFLVTGALGQIGSELVLSLRDKYGKENVVASDIRGSDGYLFEQLDVLNKNQISSVIKKHKIEVIYHLAAILSATGEQDPNLCWDVNINGLHNVLEISRTHSIKQIITPSSIAVFGKGIAKDNVSQDVALLPQTIYGVTKVSGELLCDYYVKKFNMDIRGLRYPGLVSHKTRAGGGSTDYAVDIFYHAVEGKKYTCYLNKDTIIPMMFMDDAVRGIIELAEADILELKHFSNYNFAGVSFSCEELAEEIKKYIPDFKIEYKPDFRQDIADSWPRSIDDSCARSDWGWSHEYDLSKMTKKMIKELSA
jgi:nucleoside-diphosphate-sugar epimerase